jgi:hypothetical protein
VLIYEHRVTVGTAAGPRERSTVRGAPARKRPVRRSRKIPID